MSMISGRATPPPFTINDWTVEGSTITILNYRGDEPRRTGYQAQINNGVWIDSTEYEAYEKPEGEFIVRIRPIILGLLYGAPSDKKTTVDGPFITLSSSIIAEDEASGSVVGTLAVSNGSGSYTFSITADPDSKFAIDGDDLETDATLDYETDSSHSVTVEADNGVDDPISRIFTITVTNVLEVTLSALTLDVDEIEEGSVATTVVGALQSVTSGSTLSLIDDADGRFVLSGTNIVAGAVTTDYDIATSHNITVRETHPDATTVDSIIVITVTEIVEPPAFGSLAAIGINAYRGLILRDLAPPSHGIQGASGLYINAGNGLNIERTQAWSVLASINFAAPPSVPSIIFTNVHTAPNYPGYELFINSQGAPAVRIISSIINNFIGVDAWDGISDGIDVCDGNPHVILATYDGSSTAAGVKIYIDGVAQLIRTEAGGDSLSASIVEAGADLWVANQEGFTTSFFMGGIMYGMEISHVERDATYATAYALDTNWPLPTTGTVLSYRFTEGTGTTTRDDSANNFTGALSSAAFWI